MKKDKQLETIEVGINQEVDNVKKTKRNKKPTECKDLRRSYDHCGICGSPNIAEQGVIYCNKCGSEDEYLLETDVFFWNYSKHCNLPKPCNCDPRVEIINKRRYYYNYLKTISVKKCLDCGAVYGSFCPNNKRHGCWKHWDGRYYCRTCGYRK